MRLPAMRRRYERTATAAFGGTHKIAPRTCRPRPTRRLTARSGVGDSLGRPRCDVGAAGADRLARDVWLRSSDSTASLRESAVDRGSVVPPGREVDLRAGESPPHLALDLLQ